jgi:conjugative transfer signal peptidase TraF
MHRSVGVRRSLGRLVGVLAGLGAVAVGVQASGLRVQHTGSLPRGLYRTVRGPLVRGAIGMWCLPEVTARWARARGYLHGGGCPGDAEPVGKVVLAVAGDTVGLDVDGVRLNGRAVHGTGLVARDARGRMMSHAAFGVYVLPPGWVWLWSPYTERSFDSRYFGPVPTGALVSLVRPVWIAP